MADKLQRIIEQERQFTLPPVFGDIDEPLRYIQPLHLTRRALTQQVSTNRKKLLLLNFNYHHDPTGMRKYIWKTICDRGEDIPYVTCWKKSPGVQMSTLIRTYARLRQYSFWLSPRGDGIDCHRTWEALYLDAIPIVWNSSLNSLYKDLPVVVIQNSSEITEPFLTEMLEQIAREKYSMVKKEYRFEKLRNAYWRRLILSKSRHYYSSFQSRAGMCWRGRTSVW